MSRRSIDLVDTVVFLVAVYAVTIATAVYQPATGGYFNLGEAVIYLAAIVSGPLTAAIAGGVGAALADLSTGYGIFAPGTLVIKFAEGYLAGVLVNRLRGRWLHAAGAGVGAFYAALLMVFALYYWAGEVYVGPEEFLGKEVSSPSVYLGTTLWVVLAALLGALIAYAVQRRILGSLEAVSLLLAGMVMVSGYFLYEYFISNPLTGRDPMAAVAEIPINIGQSVLGASVAIPLAAWLRRAGYAREPPEG